MVAEGARFGLRACLLAARFLAPKRFDNPSPAYRFLRPASRRSNVSRGGLREGGGQACLAFARSAQGRPQIRPSWAQGSGQTQGRENPCDRRSSPPLCCSPCRRPRGRRRRAAPPALRGTIERVAPDRESLTSSRATAPRRRCGCSRSEGRARRRRQPRRHQAGRLCRRRRRAGRGRGAESARSPYLPRIRCAASATVAPV